MQDDCCSARPARGPICTHRPKRFTLPCWQGADSGDTVDTFTHCLGVYLGFRDESMPETVRKWNVKRFELQHNDRHRDLSVVQEIWQAIDLFLGNSTIKKTLAY